ncbi:hypothetical protein GCM10010517_31370 [Streptosporangium fragile]|uniref:Uncharacterized protein n=1 Tax=Streptosporangium fragile TaxID=46186 RepID=A0ABN3VXK8_9ACTN
MRSGTGAHRPAASPYPGDPASLATWLRVNYAFTPSVRYLAAVMAEEQPVHHLLPLFEHTPVKDGAWAELVACLLQELVVRGVRLTRVPAAVRCAEALRELGHPLARLPLKRVRGERGLSVYVYLPKPPELREIPAIPDRPEGVVEGGDRKLINAAVAHWGLGTGILLKLPERLGPEDLVPLGINRFLPEGLRASVVLNGVRTDLAVVVSKLFDAAYQRATHKEGLRGGYGRPAVWRSVAGLIGAPADAPVHRINELAARWHWLMFEVIMRHELRYRDGELVYDAPGWRGDLLAVGALSPRGDRLGLLINEDTD